MSTSLSTPPVVAVSQRVDFLAERAERRDALDQRLCRWLLDAGCLPMPVPNCLVDPESEAGDPGWLALRSWLAASRPAALLLSGGNDVGKVPERDLTERGLLSWAEENRLPVLGICRGMQMMALWAGGTLKPVAGHARTRHILKSTEGGGNRPGEVNSFHQFALAECPLRFDVTARAEDGVIESIRRTDLRWEGWMWHPEREHGFSPLDLARVRNLFSA